MEEILAASRVRRLQESGRSDRIQEGLEGGGARTARSMVVAGGRGMLGWSQVTPRWVDDPMQRHVGCESIGAGGVCSPRKEIRRRK